MSNESNSEINLNFLPMHRPFRLGNRPRLAYQVFGPHAGALIPTIGAERGVRNRNQGRPYEEMPTCTGALPA